MGGNEAELLNAGQLPPHIHTLRADSSGGDSVIPEERVISKVGRLRMFDDATPEDLVIMGGSSIATTGGGQTHNNMQPSITLNCIIATEGLFPSRS
jgi:microcystin-dependent protein